MRTRALYGIRKGCDNTKLELLFGIIAWHAQKCPLLKLFLVYLEKQPEKHALQYNGGTHLNVRDCGFEMNTPIDEAVRTVYDTLVVQTTEGFNHSL